MIAVDVNDIVELHDAGMRVLTESLGPDATEAFLNITFGGTGDYTAEKKLRPPMCREELQRLKESYKTKTEAKT
jgi:hypothetical protein